MSLPPSELHAISALEPHEQIRTLKRLFAGLPMPAHGEASDIVASLPRLIHHLAVAGALAEPSAEAPAFAALRSVRPAL